jgi:hypothetical protein
VCVLFGLRIELIEYAMADVIARGDRVVGYVVIILLQSRSIFQKTQMHPGFIASPK